MLAIIGGSGLDTLPSLAKEEEQEVCTPFGSTLVKLGRLNGKSIAFLPRHGSNHSLAPHIINYRANCWALKQVGVTSVIACNVVGGISKFAKPGNVILPTQMIDYTWGREHTFYDGHSYPNLPPLDHANFCEPITPKLLNLLKTKLVESEVVFTAGAVYGCTQGPRLETAAEIARLKADGCDLVGMTAMPEAVLARELGLDYVMISYVVNWAAGVVDGELIASPLNKNIGAQAYSELSLVEIIENVQRGAQKISKILEGLVVILNI